MRLVHVSDILLLLALFKSFSIPSMRVVAVHWAVVWAAAWIVAPQLYIAISIVAAN